VKPKVIKNTRERARSTQKSQGILYYAADSAIYRKREKFSKILSLWSYAGTHNSILRRTSVTDFRFFFWKNIYFYSKISYVVRWTSWINITRSQSKSSKISELQVYSLLSKGIIFNPTGEIRIPQ